MPQASDRTEVFESLERVAGAVGRRYANDVRVLRRAVREAAPTYDAPVSYSTPEAAQNLGVTLPTIHTWVRAGVLIRAPDSRTSRVRLDRERVDEVAHRLRELRRRAPRTRKLRDVLEWLESQDYGDRLRGPRRPKKPTGVPWRESLTRAWGSTRSRARQR